MKQFSIASAGQYAFDVDVIVNALSNQLVPLNTSDLWRVVATFVFPVQFQKFIIHRGPSSSAKFLSYLDQFSKLYEQRVAMEYDIRRPNIDNFPDTSAPSHSPSYKHSIKSDSDSHQSSTTSFPNHSPNSFSSRPQPYSSPPPRKVQKLTKDSTNSLAWQQTAPCPIDQICHNCMEVGLHFTANCPDLKPSSEQRNVNAVFASSPSHSSDALRDFTSFDHDHTIVHNP